MREVKFRAIYKGKIKGFIVLHQHESKDGKMWSAHNFGGSYDELNEFIGLLDKRGQEVYEGDICKGIFETQHGTIEMIGEVYYDYTGFRMKVIKGDKKRKGMVNFFDFIEDRMAIPGADIFDFEVIGNVYENKKLLKGGGQK